MFLALFLVRNVVGTRADNQPSLRGGAGGASTANSLMGEGARNGANLSIHHRGPKARSTVAGLLSSDGSGA